MSWTTFGIIADIIGVISFIISIPALITAKNAKKALREYKSKLRFDAEIDTRIQSLDVLQNSISKDDQYDANILKNVYKELDTILIHHKEAIPPSDAKMINRLMSDVYSSLSKIMYTPDYNKQTIELRLNSAIETLKRIKKDNESK